MDYKLGDVVWYVPRGWCLLIKCTIDEVQDEFRKLAPNAFLFYWVDEPVGHALADDEFTTDKEEAIKWLRIESEVIRTFIPDDYSEHQTLEEYREHTEKFIMSTWEETNRVWTVGYKNKKQGEDWFNLNDLQKENSSLV